MYVGSRCSERRADLHVAGQSEAAPQATLLTTVSDVLFREHRLSILHASQADRAALSLGRGLEEGRLVPLTAAMTFAAVLRRCEPTTETEVLWEGHCAWLRASSEHRGEHHIINLTPGSIGEIAQLVPLVPAEERRPTSKPWAGVLQQHLRARESMCACCAARELGGEAREAGGGRWEMGDER